MELPLVSVIIPTYNYAHYILKAIDSLRHQSYPWNKIEIVVIDDGSTDNTGELLNSHRANGELVYIYQENHGKAHATKRAIQECSGKYIFNLDADDYFLPDKISKFVEVFESDLEVVHVASPAKLVDSEGQDKSIENIPTVITNKAISGSKLLRYFYANNILFGGGSTYAARASILQSIDIPVSVDMYIDEFLLLALLPFGKSYIFKNPLSVWRIHSSNYSSVRFSDQQKVLAKGARAIQSSNSILAYIKNNSFEDDIVRIYTLKNITQHIAYKETDGTKNVNDIFRYMLQIITQVGIRPRWFVKHYTFNRLLPLTIFRLIKRKRFPAL